MSEQINVKSRTGKNIDLQGILRDVTSQWRSIVMIALSLALLTYVAISILYHPTYTTRAKMFVTSSGKSSVYTDVYNSSQVASKFTEIVNSNVLQNKVAKEMGQKSFVGTASAKNIEETNIMEISVSAPSAEISFREMKSILDNYSSVSDYVLNGVILKILDPPRVPTGPDQYNNALKMSVVAFFGMIILMMGVLGFLSFRRDTIRTEKDVESKLDTTILASIPHEETARTLRAKLKRESRPILITDPAVSFQYVEAMDKLARRVRMKMDERNAKTLLVSSVMQNEGKSSVAANLALSMAKQGMKVILVDCDLRKPSQYKLMGFEKEEFVSLGDCLRSEANPSGVIHSMEGTNLLLVLNKVILSNSTELITSEQFQSILSILRNNVDYVVIDSSPMALVADAEELAVVADASMLVVRQNMVEAIHINDAIDGLNASGDKVMGCVFNDVYHEGAIARFGYYGYYGAKSYSYGKYSRGGRYER